MKIKSIKANQTQVELKDGTLVLISYETPVAAFVVGKGIIRTNKKWSVRTTRHINQWISDNYGPYVTVTEVNQSELYNLR